MAPLGTLGPTVAYESLLDSIALAAFAQYYHLVGIAGLNFGKLLQVFVGIISI